MNQLRCCAIGISVAVLVSSGCTAPRGRLTQVEPPARPAKLAAFDVFVGDWDWNATVVGLDDPEREWSGQATWQWTLDKRFLHGSLTMHNARLSYEATGLWSWHPTKKNYAWWMFNSWGYPQEGTAHYDAGSRRWIMPYTSVGLDGSTSYGRYEMHAVSDDRLEWSMVEWADPLHLIEKIEMTGEYRRRR